MSAVAPSAATRHGCLGMGMGRARELGAQGTTAGGGDRGPVRREAGTCYSAIADTGYGWVLL